MSEPNLYGNDLFGDPIADSKPNKLAEDFCVPPFSVLSAREGWWQDRKRAWIALGIKSELGRAAAEDFGSGAPGTIYECWRARANLIDLSDQVSSPGMNHYREAERSQTASLRGGLTHGTTTDPYRDSDNDSAAAASGTSIFDPVLCELSYRWYCPPGGMVLDPFAGGSVRGIVATMLGRHYHGIDLRPEQIAANREQAAMICSDVVPEWVVGDAREMIDAAPPADFLFSCPPYFDLERYSDDPRDLSAMSWGGFIAAYHKIVATCAARLRPDRFACFVVGDIRGPSGSYRGLPELTVEAFGRAGMPKYNEAILVTRLGSLPVRVRSQFVGSRKLGKTHQNILVFIKGDPKKAAALVPQTGEGAS